MTEWTPRIGELFGEHVAVHTIRVDPAIEPIAAEVPAQLASSARSRRVEYLAGRQCARQALRDLGGPQRAELAIGELGAPEWPAGFVGSITHTSELAAAVAARSEHARALGLDIEAPIALEEVEQSAPFVAARAELERVRAIGLSEQLALTVVFSAKEALFKLLAPLLRRSFDFLDADVVEAGAGSLMLSLSIDTSSVCAPNLRVRFAQVEGHVVTAARLAPFTRP